MQHKRIPLADTKAFSPFFLDYISKNSNLKHFYGRFPEITSFADQISEKDSSFPEDHRSVLKSVIKEQYKGLKVSERTSQNIESLSDRKTFTITTGHQLNIFTGPLFFIYKIVTVINACKALAAKYPDFHFVPVYWMASEDHDFEEISWFRLYGKKYVWTTDQRGPVGEFKNDGLAELLNEVPGDISLFRDAYLKNATLASAVRHYVNALFGSDGIVVIDANHREFKKMLIPVMRNDIIGNDTVKLVNATNKHLESKGYQGQVHCREINFFYQREGLRSRIEKKDGLFHVIDTDIKFDEAQITEEIQSTPERFSPNVILRPLYQEIILPNLAYTGGPAEILYWLQLKDVFKNFRVPFPILLPRNFGLIIDHTVQRKLDKTGMELHEFFEDKNYLFNHWVLKHMPKEVSVQAERKGIEEIYDGLKRRAGDIDKTLTAFTAAETTRVLKGLDKIERRFIRAQKRLHADRLRQIEQVKDALFPGGSLQERIDNFLNFYQRDKQFISKLISAFDPFDFRFNVLTYTNHEQEGAQTDLS